MLYLMGNTEVIVRIQLIGVLVQYNVFLINMNNVGIVHIIEIIRVVDAMPAIYDQ